MSVDLRLGDCLEVLKTLPDNSVDSVITDPPAGIGFMGKTWDTFNRGEWGRAGREGTNDLKVKKAFNILPRYQDYSREAFIEFMTAALRECLRVAKPGAFLLCWAIPRTSHWTGTAIENAGWIIRDRITHLFGCLSDDTEILTENGWGHYQRIALQNLALCYNLDKHSFEWSPIQEVFVYDYADTAYRIISNSTDQLVSRNHRCIVERGGREIFAPAETLKRQESVPILEGLSDLLKAIPLPNQRTGRTQSALPRLLRQSDQPGQARQDARDSHSDLQTVPILVSDSAMEKEERYKVLFKSLRGALACQPTRFFKKDEGNGCIGAAWLDGKIGSFLSRQDDWIKQSRVERRRYLLSQAWQLCVNQIRSLPERIFAHGSMRWLCDGASASGGAGIGTMPLEVRGCSSRRSQSTEQSSNKPRAISKQFGTQTIRGEGYIRTTLARVIPIDYHGKVWCVRVSTGAFVARRKGKVFITGNSGFPKSLNISKAIDDAAGAARKIGGIKPGHEEFVGRSTGGDTRFQGGMDGFHRPWMDDVQKREQYHLDTEPVTDLAREWDGYFTGLKPACEDWWLAMKPLDGNFAENANKWGVAGLNIRDTRLGNEKEKGRYPANVIMSHSPDCVLVGTRKVKNNSGNIHGDEPSRPAKNVYGNHRQRHPFKKHGDSDGREEVELWACVPDCPVRLLDEQSGYSETKRITKPSVASAGNTWRGTFQTNRPQRGYSDSGGSSRFFYVAKASRSEREAGLEELEPRQTDESRKPGNPGGNNPRNRGAREAKNNHPTVKALTLMEYLVNLTRTPRGGVVLDPFMGSGTTGVACVNMERDFIGIENDTRYFEIAQKRIAHAQLQMRMQLESEP